MEDKVLVGDVPETGLRGAGDGFGQGDMVRDPDSTESDRCACGKRWSDSTAQCCSAEPGGAVVARGVVLPLGDKVSAGVKARRARPVRDIEACDRAESPPGGRKVAVRDGVGVRPPQRGELRVFSMEEVARHSSPDDVWLVAHGKVYDVTSMMDHHPGGRRSILRHAGQESTVDFDFHSKPGQHQWLKYQIGVLDTAQRSCAIV